MQGTSGRKYEKDWFKTGFPKLLVHRYPLDAVAGLHVPLKCCDVSLKQGGLISSPLQVTFRNCSS